MNLLNCRGSWARLLLWSALSFGAGVSAQTIAAPELKGKTLEGPAIELATLKGKVVYVTFWDTNLHTSREMMYELRQNYQGWADKPFEIIAVSTDRKLQDLQEFQRINNIVVPIKQRFPMLWAGRFDYADNLGKSGKLPITYVIDKTGKVALRFEGRVPPEAWDSIAELVY